MSPHPVIKCPLCNAKILDKKKIYICNNLKCSFKMYKDNFFLKKYRMRLTQQLLWEMCTIGKSKLKGMWSEKKNCYFDATLVWKDKEKCELSYIDPVPHSPMEKKQVLNNKKITKTKKKKSKVKTPLTKTVTISRKKYLPKNAKEDLYFKQKLGNSKFL